MTLSSPGRTAPNGKMNLSSVSSMMFRLFVELLIYVSGRRSRSRNDVPHFPNEVLRKTSLSHTLAAKADRIQLASPNVHDRVKN